MTDPHHPGLTRRDILKRGAAFGGALLWATPVVQVVGMSPAHARPVSPGCIRYCLKWETDGNSRILDTETGDHQRTCDDLVIWTSFWVGLGGANADEPDAAAATTSGATGSAAATSTTTSTTTTATTVPAEEELGEVEETEELGAQATSGEEVTESATSSDPTPEPAGKSQGNGRNGPPDGPPGGGPPEGPPGGGPAVGGPGGGGPGGGPPDDHPGNCIECDTNSSVNDSAAAQQLAENMGIEVYGDPITGFYVSIPSDCGLADLDEEGLDSAAVKVGGPGGGDCSVVVTQEPDPCRPGYTRIVLPNPTMTHDISHIELIIDCCE